MSMEVDDVVLLAGADQSQFERALLRISKRAAGAQRNVYPNLFKSVQGLDQARILSDRERARRIRLLLLSLRPDTRDLRQLAGDCRDMSGATKQAIMGVLPPDLRAALYSHHRGHTNEAPSGRRPTEASDGSLSEWQDASAASREHTVWLLGSDDDHAANIPLLKQHDFVPLRMNPSGDPKSILSSDACGIVVGASWWSERPFDEHGKALRELFRLSSLWFFRLDLDGLDEDACARVGELRRDTYAAEVDPLKFVSGYGAKLTRTDIEALKGVADLLTASRETRFHPEELESGSSLLVRVAATWKVRAARLDYDLKLHQILTSPFGHGRSGAKTVLVRPDDGGVGFVIKLDRSENLRREMEKYHKHISRWDGRANPELLFHGDAGAIVFSVLASAERPEMPAPTLDAQLEVLLNSELGDVGGGIPHEGDIAIALQRTARKLAELNGHQVEDMGINCDWMADTIECLDQRGIRWVISDTRGESINLCHRASDAANIVGKYKQNTIHGDVHLQNILLNDNREPFLIDYAQSGPGHPCYDLVRLESAVTYRCFRTLVAEDRLAELILAVSVDGAEYPEIVSSFPDLLSSVGNRLAIRTCIESRAHCLALMQKSGGTLQDYLAMKFLVAAQSLAMLGMQSSVARATIRALSTCF